MKKNLVKSIALVAMVVFAAISANAQRVNKNINAYDAQACGEYLSINPSDTILNVYNIEKDGKHGVVTRRVFFVGSTTLRGDNDTVWTAESKNTAVKQYKKTTVSQLSDAELNEINAGQRQVIDTKCRDYDGNSHQHFYAAGYAGGRFGENVSPLAGVRLGFECRRFGYEFDVHYALNEYPDGARAEGRSFNSLGAGVRFSVKFLHDRNFRRSLAVVVGTGGEYQETDKFSLGGKSANLAWTYRIGLQGKLAFSKRFGVFAEVSYGNVPFVQHNSEQDLNHHAVNAEGGVYFNLN